MSDDRSLIIEFGGTSHCVEPGHPFTIGREADLTLGDDPFLHRRFLLVDHRHDMWFIANVGSRLTATVAAPATRMEAFLGSGATLPLVCERMTVSFTTTSTSYLLTLVNQAPQFTPPVVEVSMPLAPTTRFVGRLTDSQMLMLLTLAESRLRGTSLGSTVFPTSVEAAQRLDWTVKQFEKKIDNVCDKFDKLGVKGLRGGGLGLNAANRRARLVEYAVATGIVQPEDLSLLDRHTSVGRETLDGT